MSQTLYHCYDARSFRVLWALEELGLAYDLRMLPFPPRVHARDYLTLNPLGTIPLFIDGDTRMTESSAIIDYLAVRHGDGRLAVAPQEPAFGAYLNALHFGEATLTFPQTLVLRYSRLEPPARRQPQVAKDYARWFLARLKGLEALLDGSDYAAAGRFTVADISIGYALKVAEALDMPLPKRVQAYWERLQARDGYQAALAAQETAAQAQGVPAIPLNGLSAQV